MLQEQTQDVANRSQANAAGQPARAIARLFDFVFLLRPTLFFPVWTVYAAGYFVGRSRAAMPADQPNNWPLVIGLALTFLLGSAFVLNQIVDEKIDRENNKLFLIANGHVPRKLAGLEAALLALLSMLTGFLYSAGMGFLFVLIYGTTGILYSLPPFKWKDRAIRGLLANSLGAAAIFCAGWSTSAGLSLRALAHALPYVFAVSAVYALTTLLDRDGDARYQKLTLAVRFGERPTLWLAVLLVVLSLLGSLLLGDGLIVFPALASVPLFFIAAIGRKQEDVDRAIKYPILFLALVISFKWYLFFPLILFTFYFAKMYYRYRFGLNYPSFQAE